jgi:glycosyltransferase involved in cell wall biosynthesis
VRNVLKAAYAVAKTVELVRRRGVHLVHTHNAKAHFYGGLAATVAGIPCLYHLHGVPKPSLSRDGIVSLLSVMVPARRTVACSRYVAEAFERTWGSRRELCVVHNGVTLDPGRIADRAGTVRQEFAIPENAPLVVLACRLQRQKGVHVFVDAAARVARVYPGARFMIVGGTLLGLEEEYGAQLREQADRLGLAGCTIFTGFRSDVYRFLAEADLVVHSSTGPDSFPTIILEALALGKPVVASDLGGSGEIIEHGVTGLLVSPERPDQLAGAILTLLDEPERRFMMGKAGVLLARERFGADRMVRQVEGLYEQLVGDRPNGPC